MTQATKANEKNNGMILTLMLWFECLRRQNIILRDLGRILQPKIILKQL